jgi:hypothetical protein
VSDRHQNPAIDLVILTRDDSPLNPQVQQGIAFQADVRLFVHRVIGNRSNQDQNRWSAIARARNTGKRRGTSAWLMFLDDDVVLAPNCVRALWDGLRTRPDFAALAADYLNESRGRMACSHIAMGATLFRRAALDLIEFRWVSDKCECLCCCHDLRRRRMGIGYLPEARASHISGGERGARRTIDESKVSSTDRHVRMEQSGPRPAYILTAFDRKHCDKFTHRFMTSLRGAGNKETVLAFACGLYPSEQRTVASLTGVQLIHLAPNGVHIALRRLLEFQRPLERLPPRTPVAYWDAGDVIFQDRLSDLWSLVDANPDRLLITAEKAGRFVTSVIDNWISFIADAGARRAASELMFGRPFFNSGFIAGTAATMLRYLKAGDALLHSTALRGVKHWGDQMAANLYCHNDPSNYLEVDDRWNYCLAARQSDEVWLLPDGRFIGQDKKAIAVVHGNGGTFKRFASWSPEYLARASKSSKFLI